MIVHSDTSGQLLRDFLRVTEFDYNPAEPSAAELALGFTDNNDFEFIELTNTGVGPLDLDGAAFTDGIDYTFDGQDGPVTLAPGASLVVVGTSRRSRPATGQVFSWPGSTTGNWPTTARRSCSATPSARSSSSSPTPTIRPGRRGRRRRRVAAPPGGRRLGATIRPTGRAAPPTPGLSVVESSVVGRYVFYNNSQFDGDDPAASGVGRRRDRHRQDALLPGDTATFANYTSYSRGINGIMIDVADLPSGITPQATDFVFLVGNDDDPARVDRRAAPKSVSIRPGDGVGGSARITILWDDHAIENQWLRVQVLAARLGLARRRRVLLGQRPRRVGRQPAHALVNVTDVLAMQANLHGPLAPAGIDDRHDFNRDGLVNATDAVLARDHMTSPLGALRLIAPAAAEPSERAVLGAALAELAEETDRGRATGVANRQPAPFGPLSASHLGRSARH